MNRMVAQLMDHDIKLFIYEAQKLNDTHWFSTHLINLIHHCVQLKSYFDQNNMWVKLIEICIYLKDNILYFLPTVIFLPYVIR